MGKESACNAGSLGSIPGLGRSPGRRPHSSTLGLENPMDRGAWQASVHGVTKSRTQLSSFHLRFCEFYFHAQKLFHLQNLSTVSPSCEAAFLHSHATPIPWGFHCAPLLPPFPSLPAEHLDGKGSRAEGWRVKDAELSLLGLHCLIHFVSLGNR